MSSPNPPRPSDMTRDQILGELILRLSTEHWHDLTGEEGLDPEAVETWGTGYEGRRNGTTVFLLSRYDDEGRPYALVSSTGVRLTPKQVTTEDYMLAWLWENIRGSRSIDGDNREADPVLPGG